MGLNEFEEGILGLAKTLFTILYIAHVCGCTWLLFILCYKSILGTGFHTETLLITIQMKDG